MSHASLIIKQINKSVQEECRLIEERIQTRVQQISAEMLDIQVKANHFLTEANDKIKLVKTDATDANDMIKSVNTDVAELNLKVNGIMNTMIDKKNFGLVTKCMEYLQESMDEMATKKSVEKISISCLKFESAITKTNTKMNAKVKELKDFMAEVYVEGETVGWMQDHLDNLESKLKDLTSVVAKGNILDERFAEGCLKMRSSNFSFNEKCLEEEVWRHLMK